VSSHVTIMNSDSNTGVKIKAGRSDLKNSSADKEALNKQSLQYYVLGNSDCNTHWCTAKEIFLEADSLSKYRNLWTSNK